MILAEGSALNALSRSDNEWVLHDLVDAHEARLVEGRAVPGVGLAEGPQALRTDRKHVSAGSLPTAEFSFEVEHHHHITPCYYGGYVTFSPPSLCFSPVMVLPGCNCNHPSNSEPPRPPGDLVPAMAPTLKAGRSVVLRQVAAIWGRL